MPKPNRSANPKLEVLLKSPTGIKGLDEITGGGLPKGRPTLVCGGTGCGKTLLAMEFLVRGATEYDEPGVFMSFEEKSEELAKNFASLGFDLNDLANRKKIVSTMCISREARSRRPASTTWRGCSSASATPSTPSAPNASCSTQSRHCFPGCRMKIPARGAQTPVPLSERQRGHRHRHRRAGGADPHPYGLEEYVADCVIFLSHNVNQQIATRRLRIIKYRGSSHGTNEYPFSDRRAGLLRHADLLPRPRPPGCQRAGLHRHSAPRHHAGRERVLPGKQHPCNRHGRNRVSRAWPPILSTPPAGAASAASISPSRNPKTRSSAICAPSASTWSNGWTRAC